MQVINFYLYLYCQTNKKDMSNTQFAKELKNEIEVIVQLFQIGLITSSEYVKRVEATNAELRNLKAI